MNIQPINISKLEHHELQSSRTGEKYSLSADLSTPLGLKNMFVHHEIIPPGRRSSAPHAHSHREEMIVVLEGVVTAHTQSQEKVLVVGDSIAFHPGQENIHFVRNHGDSPARVLIIATSQPQDEVSY